MTDRTDAFLAQLDEFRKLDFTGETTFQWKRGHIMEMGVNQRIRPTENTSVRSAVVLQPNTAVGAVLDSNVGQV